MQNLVGGPWTGATTLQGHDPLLTSVGGFGPPKGINQVFGLYTEPGTWTLSGLNICLQTCTSYDSMQIAKLFSRTTLTIKNPNPDDLVGPVAQSAVIRSTTISLANSPYLAIDIDVSEIFPAPIPYR